MSAPILASFFFLHIVENYKRSHKSSQIKLKDFDVDETEMMKCFSVVYTIMETQATGFGISEKDLEISAAIVSAFSLIWCLGVTDPYLITSVMWEAYKQDSLSSDSGNYKKLIGLANRIIHVNERENEKHTSQSI